MRKLTRRVVVLAAPMLLAGVAGSTKRVAAAAPMMPAQPVEIKIGTPAALGLALFWDLQIADKRGMFRQNNLMPQFLEFAGPAPAIQALVAGSVNFVSAATDAGVYAIDAGAPLKFIAGQSFAGHALAVSADIRSYPALKGKRIAATDLQTGTTVVLRALLQKNGLGPNDYNIIPIADRYGALRTGAVAGALPRAAARFSSAGRGVQRARLRERRDP